MSGGRKFKPGRGRSCPQSIMMLGGVGVGALLGLYMVVFVSQFHLMGSSSHAAGHEAVHRSKYTSASSSRAGGPTTADPPPFDKEDDAGGGGEGSAAGRADAPFSSVSSAATSAEEEPVNRPRIIFAVPMPWPLKDDLAKDNLVATISTWGSHATRLVLVVSQQQIDRFPPDTSLGARHSQIKDYLYPVPMTRPDGIANGRHIWEKMWRGWKLVGDRFRHEAEWFVKADLDTFVAVENMRAFLSHLNPDDPYYFGHTLFHDWGRHNLVFNSGTCYVLSRESLRRLTIRLDRIETDRKFTYQCGDGPGAREDPHTAGCLRDVGVPASDSLDNQGRQRFLTFRPKDHLFAMKVEPGRERTWFWMYKDTSRQLLDCCSNYPISFHNFKSHPKIVYDPEAYYTLEYYLSARPYEAILEGMDPPRGNGQPFEIPKELPVKVDPERNWQGAPKNKMFFTWLRGHPDAYACVNRTKACKCNIPNEMPLLGVGATLEETGECQLGGKLSLGGKCKVRCRPGYKRVGSNRDDVFLTCPDGAMLYSEPIQCRAECRTDALEKLRARAQAHGDKVEEDPTGAMLTCGPGRSLRDGKKRGTVDCQKGEFAEAQECSKCTHWVIELKGTSYTHKDWQRLEFDGNERTKFQVAAVATGGASDPVKNCQQWHQEHQLVLRVKDGPIIKALSCGNQVIHIEKTTPKTGRCP